MAEKKKIKGFLCKNMSSECDFSFDYIIANEKYDIEYNEAYLVDTNKYTKFELSNICNGDIEGKEIFLVARAKTPYPLGPQSNESYIYDSNSNLYAVYQIEYTNNRAQLRLVTIANDAERKLYKIDDTYYPVVTDDMFDDNNNNTEKDAQNGYIEETCLNGAIENSFDITKYESFMNEEVAPATVHPNLWRMERLNNYNGLFKVLSGEVGVMIYQIRTFDLATMSFVRLGLKNHWLVIDPLGNINTAKKAIDTFKKQEPYSIIKAVIITHSHIDHYNGLKAVLDAENATILQVKEGGNFDTIGEGQMLVVAPNGFYEESLSENLFLGNCMGRRATYMYGNSLPVDKYGHVGAGLGKTVGLSVGVLLKPSIEIGNKDGDFTKLEVEGIKFTFQNVPGTEAPAEFHVFIDTYKALCPGENVCKTMHNLLTPRGAKVRDPKAFGKAINDAIEYIETYWENECDVIIGTHHWPTWGTTCCMNLLAKQRDMYYFFNDQVIRLLNKGMNMEEIAECFYLPDSLNREYFNRGYYGTINHNVKAVVQRYVGWWDGNPANYFKYPDTEVAKRFITDMGGEDAVLSKAYDYFSIGDYRWTVELTRQVVFYNPRNTIARCLQADALEQLAYSFEAGTWRNIYLTAAFELRGIPMGLKSDATEVDYIIQATASIKTLTPKFIFEYLATLLDGFKASEENKKWYIKIGEEKWLVDLSNGVLHSKDISQSSTDSQFIVFEGVEDFANDFYVTMNALLNNPLDTSGKLSSFYKFIDAHNPMWNIIEPLKQ